MDAKAGPEGVCGRVVLDELGPIWLQHSRTKQMAREEAFGDHHTRWNIVPRSTPPLDDLMH